MPEQRYIVSPEGRSIPVPEYKLQPDGSVEPEPPEEEMEEEEEVVDENGDDREDMSDLTSLDEEDQRHLFGVGGTVDSEEEDDLSDLVDVADEDITGEEPKRKNKFAKRTRFYRSTRQRYQPPTSFGGMRDVGE